MLTTSLGPAALEVVGLSPRTEGREAGPEAPSPSGGGVRAASSPAGLVAV